ncbi:MAG: AraC family transcriptional regulator [Gluconacetobacter diazotrophicus]|nr:AraC family transcriptional regulator [Gluconacetobacter diazotrophicus]
MRDLLDRMRDRVLRHTDGMRPHTPVPRLGIGTTNEPATLDTVLYEPAICLVPQGRKRVRIGDRDVIYDPTAYFAAALDLSGRECSIQILDGNPFVASSLLPDRASLAALLADLPPQEPSDHDAGHGAGFGTAPVTPGLIEAWDALLSLLDTPADIPFLAAAREREVLYRLLRGPHGPMLRHAVRADRRLFRIRRVIDWIGRHFDQKLCGRTLAGIAGMSVPSLHRHFRAATAMSPLQYQKTLRLHAARRLLVSSAEAARAAYAVGYESPSQFSRDYNRLFGLPPSRDAARLRGGPAAGGAISAPSWLATASVRTPVHGPASRPHGRFTVETRSGHGDAQREFLTADVAGAVGRPGEDQAASPSGIQGRAT